MGGTAIPDRLEPVSWTAPCAVCGQPTQQACLVIERSICGATCFEVIRQEWAAVNQIIHQGLFGSACPLCVTEKGHHP